MSLEEQFESLDAEAINSFIAEKQEENLRLEFKLVNQCDLSNRHPSHSCILLNRIYKQV